MRMRNGWLFSLALVAVTGVAHAGEDGWVNLFNGKDLTGWRYYKEKLDGKTETADKRFSVADGIIVANVGKGIKDLYTVQEFGAAFHLKVEFRAAPKADSGVYVRGPQLQVRDYQRRKERNLKKFKDDDWNELDIIVKGAKVTASVNLPSALTPNDNLEIKLVKGKAAAFLNGEALKNPVQLNAQSIAHCRCNGEFLEDMPVPAKGGIGLQAETGKFEFRNIRLKELK